MHAHPGTGTPQTSAAVATHQVVGFVRRPAPRFAAEALGMCAVMCVAGNLLSLAFFQGLGYSYLVKQSPALAVLVISINLAVPMAAYMALRGHGWRHNMAMTGSTIAVGAVIAVLSATVIPTSSMRSWGDLFGLVCGPACALMVIQMVRSHDMYTGRAHHHARPT